jgi:hypothetical protein
MGHEECGRYDDFFNTVNPTQKKEKVNNAAIIEPWAQLCLVSNPILFFVFIASIKKGKKRNSTIKLFILNHLKMPTPPQSLSIILSGFIDFLRELTIQKTLMIFLIIVRNCTASLR